jgi:hypothetical protein
MLAIIAGILFLLWILGFAAFHVTTGFIHFFIGSCDNRRAYARPSWQEAPPCRTDLLKPAIAIFTGNRARIRVDDGDEKPYLRG